MDSALQQNKWKIGPSATGPHHMTIYTPIKYVFVPWWPLSGF